MSHEQVLEYIRSKQELRRNASIQNIAERVQKKQTEKTKNNIRNVSSESMSILQKALEAKLAAKKGKK